MNREKRTEIIAIRVDPAAKKRILEEAQRREETLNVPVKTSTLSRFR